MGLVFFCNVEFSNALCIPCSRRGIATSARHVNANGAAISFGQEFAYPSVLSLFVIRYVTRNAFLRGLTICQNNAGRSNVRERLPSDAPSLQK